jgi:2-aminoethylphosphonate-pyruvate transaminase
VLLPQGISFEALHNEMKAKGFIIYAGKGPLSKKTFQVANMGVLTKEDIYKFLEAFEASLVTLGFGFQ